MCISDREALPRSSLGFREMFWNVMASIDFNPVEEKKSSKARLPSFVRKPLRM
jgi:hypothetical protein